MFVIFTEMLNVLSMIAVSFVVLAITYFVMQLVENLSQRYETYNGQNTKNAAAQGLESAHAG